MREVVVPGATASEVAAIVVAIDAAFDERVDPTPLPLPSRWRRATGEFDDPWTRLPGWRGRS